MESAMTEAAARGLRFQTDVPSRIRAGEPVPIVLRVKNIGTQPQELYLRGRTITFDLIVTRADGSVVWSRLEGQTIPAILRIEVLAPDQELVLEDRRDQRTMSGEPAGPGLYTVHGLLPTDAPQPFTTPAVPLRIVPR
jgi:hypothetical protein